LNTPQDGDQEGKPLFLDGIKKNDFRSFLQILSARHNEAVTAGGVTGKTSLLLTRSPLYPFMTTDAWISALHLSHMWGFENVRTKVIQVIEANATVGMIQRLKLANDFQITSWIRPAYQFLMTRNEELNLFEVPWLGVEFVQKVTKAREERTRLFLLRVLSRGIPLPPCPTYGQGALQLEDFPKSPQQPQAVSGRQLEGDSANWTLQCRKRENHPTGSVQVVKYSWTPEELMRVEY